ncbi:MAG: T9SS type A sorting domain-containing protein [Kaistella sp.]|nr:T9SS type A sorting domain-containing protein [Kaistella sp.]
MKKIITLLCAFLFVFSYCQNSSCSYINTPIENNSTGADKDPNIFALDFTIPANTVLNMQNAVLDIIFRSHGPITQAVVYIYEDNNGQPGVLVNSFNISVTSSHVYSTNTTERRTINIPLQTTPSISSTNSPKKIWLGFKFTIPDWTIFISNYKQMRVSSGLMIDGTPIKYFNAATNSWENINGFTDKDAIISINSTCSSLSTNETPYDDFIIFSNPVTDKLVLSNKNIDKVEIFDLSGKLILTSTPKSNEVDLSGLIPGNYLVKLYLENKVFSKKIIKK